MVEVHLGKSYLAAGSPPAHNHRHRLHHPQHCETSEYIKIYNQLVKVFKQAKLVKMVAYTDSENWELSNKSRSMIITVFQIKL